MTLPVHIASKIEPCPATGCWLWTGAEQTGGYGTTQLNGRQNGAHRIVFQLLRGPIPDGMVLDHIVCRTRSCVNPDHVRVVTPRQNVLENSLGLTAANASKRACPKCGAAYTMRTRNGRLSERYCAPCQYAPVQRARRGKLG